MRSTIGSVSRTVEFVDVHKRITEFGDRASLITVDADGRPHVVTVVVEIDDERLRTRVGAHTRANVAERPHLTLTWAPPAGGEYLLILDGSVVAQGEADEDGVGEIVIAVDRGILHRLAELPDPAPTCLAL